MASIWTSAAQAAQQGFDESYYLGQKAALLTTQTGTTWTVDMVKASFANAGLQAYEHYQEYGFKEGLNPNAYFNNSYYDNSKAAATPGGTAAAFQTAWNNANGGSQTSTYFHYLQYGFNEAGVNPSATFSEAQYYVDKAALLTAQTGQTWTVAQVEAAFASAGLTPITHYMLYGGTPNEPTPQPVSGGTGTTYTLTTGMDNIPGTALNDTIMAGEVNNAQTLTAGDTINGAGGTNTINVSANNAHNYAGFTMQNVQTLNVTADGGPQVFDLSGTTGLTSINSVNSSAAVQADYVATLANVGITNATAAANMTVGYQDVTGASDTVGLTMTNSSAGTIRLGGQGTNTGIETVALHSSGTASTIAGLDSQITNLTFDGSANVKIGGTLDTVKVIDASSATGGLTATIGTANANAVTFTGGSGADTITFGATSLTAADTVTGGTGSDTLVADRAGLFAAGAAGKVTGVETITMSDQLTAAATFKGGTWFADATTFNLNAGYAAGATASITTGTGTTAGQAVRIAGANGGVLTITDTATSATNDQATLGVYKVAGAAANTVANVAYTTNELETLNLTSGSTTDTTASGTTNTLTVSGGLNKTTTLNISGADNLTLTTAASSINTVAAGSALGNLDLRTVTYAVPAATTAAGATITTGSGADQVNGTIGIDTINTGAGNDIVFGTQGADSITLGTGTDQVVYTALNQSNSASTDTVADFVSGTDTFDISALGASAVATGGLNQATFALAQGALTGGGTVSAVFQQDASTLWVDMDGNGTLDANDFRVVLSGTASLAAADLGLTNVINVVGGAANTGTAGNDVFMADDAALKTAGTTIDGLAGINTLNVVDALTGAIVGPTLATNIDVINLQAGTGGFVLTVQDETDVTVNASAASLVTLGAAAGQTFNGSTAADKLTIGLAGQTGLLNGGNDTAILLATADEVGTTINGGSGTDTLNLTGVGTTYNLTSGTFSSLEVLDLDTGGAAAQTVTLAGSDFRSILFGDAADIVKATSSQVGALTTINVATAGDGTLQLTDAGTADISDATIGAGGNIGTLQYSASGNTVVIGGADIVNFGAITGGTGTDTLHIDLKGAALTFSDAGTGGKGVVTSMENITVTNSGAAAVLTATLANASGVTNFNASSLTTGSIMDIHGLTAAGTVDKTIVLGSGDDQIIGAGVGNGINTTGANNYTIDFGQGNVAIGDIGAHGTGVLTLKFGTLASATQTVNVAATTADFAAGDVFDFAGNVTAVVAANTGVAGQVIVTNAGLDTTLLYDADGNGAFGAGDTQVTITGQNLTTANLGINAHGDLYLV